MDIRTAIAYYQILNDAGKAVFILTLKKEDRKPFLDAYEEHYYKHSDETKPKTKLSTHILE